MIKKIATNLPRTFAISAAVTLMAGSSQAADQFFAGDGSALTAAKYAPTAAGPFTSAFVTGNVINFAIPNGTGTGGTISVGGITATENFTITSASGTIGGTTGTTVPINVSSGKTLDLNSQALSGSATVGFSLTAAGGVYATAGGAFGGGFTLNSGTVVARGVNALGSSATTNPLTINGGTIAGTTTRDFTGKFGGGITVNNNFQVGALAASVPQVTNDAANLTFSNAVNLTGASRTITAGANGTYTFSGVVSNGGVAIAGLMGTTGNVTLSNAANTYAGGTTLNSGTLSISSDGNVGGASTPITFNGGTLRVTGTTLTSLGTHVVNYSTFNGGIDVNTAANVFTISQALGGAGALTKAGAGTLALSVGSAFSGGTTISAGTVTAGANGALGTGNVTEFASTTLNLNDGVTNAIADTATLTLSSTNGTSNFSKLNLNQAAQGIQETVGSLIIDGVAQASGTYGSSTSGATILNDNFFGGNGILFVATGVPEPSTYAFCAMGLLSLAAIQKMRRRSA